MVFQLQRAQSPEGPGEGYEERGEVVMRNSEQPSGSQCPSHPSQEMAVLGKEHF